MLITHCQWDITTVSQSFGGKKYPKHTVVDNGSVSLHVYP